MGVVYGLQTLGRSGWLRFRFAFGLNVPSRRKKTVYGTHSLKSTQMIPTNSNVQSLWILARNLDLRLPWTSLKEPTGQEANELTYKTSRCFTMLWAYSISAESS